GHTASLFPGTAALDAPESRWYVDNYVPKLDAHRLTATYRFLRAAHRILFLVTGEAKAPALRQVLEPVDGEEVLPARGVRGGDAEVSWMVDEAAASQLSSTNLVRHQDGWPARAPGSGPGDGLGNPHGLRLRPQHPRHRDGGVRQRGLRRHPLPSGRPGVLDRPPGEGAGRAADPRRPGGR